MNIRTLGNTMLNAKAIFFVAPALFISQQAMASLILDTAVTGSFTGSTTYADTVGNDLSAQPDSVYFGQLKALQNGVLDFFYVGNEAGYVNQLMLNGLAAHSTQGLSDVFAMPHTALGSLDLTAGTFVDFGFCTSGGDSVASHGRCVSNADAGSLTAQFNHAGTAGYRSIGYRPVTGLGAFSYGSASLASDLWMIFWDDSGASNDDDYDDYVALAYFRPIQVTEPGTLALMAAALIPLVATRRRASRSLR